MKAYERVLGDFLLALDTPQRADLSRNETAATDNGPEVTARGLAAWARWRNGPKTARSPEAGAVPVNELDVRSTIEALPVNVQEPERGWD
ncbi:MAG TPA: hypothetical protein VLA09_10380 [Longimicrobiales bacterium]|nr:hypothetical protein [Longimicrobiales bacterium]